MICSESTCTCVNCRNDFDEVRRLLTAGDVQVDHSTADHRTALHLAASNGHLSMVKHLVIVHGANVNVMDRHNCNPMTDAIRGHYREVAAFLRQQGAQLKLEDAAGMFAYTQSWISSIPPEARILITK